MNALHDGGCETTQRTLWIVLLFEWTLDRVGEEESFALEFGEQCGLPRLCGERNSGGLHEFFEISAGA